MAQKRKGHRKVKQVGDKGGVQKERRKMKIKGGSTHTGWIGLNLKDPKLHELCAKKQKNHDAVVTLLER